MSYYFVGDGDGESGGDGDFDFGSTADLHQGLMGALWSPGANIAIFLIIYSYRKYWVWLHILFFAFATIITLVSSLPILSATGMIPANSTVVYDDDFSAGTLRTHYILGLVCCGAIGLVSLLGMLIKVLVICDAKSTTILLIRRIHTWCGYVAVLSCKANIYVLGEDVGLWIAIDIISIVLYILWRIFFPKLEARGVTPKYEQNIPAVKSINDLRQDKSYIVFANNIYDIQPLRYNHPAGYQIAKVLKNKQVDRYIYGSCVADELPEVPIWSHSFRSFTLMDNPVAKIDIPPTFDGFDQTQIQCNIPKPQPMSHNGNIYQLNITKKHGHFTFMKYRYITQLGRYFGLTLNDKVTRLYTTVNFLVEENTSFMQKHLKMYNRQVEEQLLEKGQKNDKIRINSGQQQNNQPIPSVERLASNKYRSNQVQLEQFGTIKVKEASTFIPIMFKVYPGGKFTQVITKKPCDKLLISCSKGEGLQLAHTKPGKIIIVAGGTGIYPFSDFIDLLYKDELINQDLQTRNEILNLSPLLGYNPFQSFQFQLLAAFTNVDEMHLITLEQLLFLAETGRMKVTFKFKQSPRTKVQEGKNIIFTSQGFQNLLDQKIKEGGISRVWICGPPGMNIMVSKFLKEKYDNPDLYLII